MKMAHNVRHFFCLRFTLSAFPCNPFFALSGFFILLPYPWDSTDAPKRIWPIYFIITERWC
ncbi:hypothetical protein KKH3_23880 [Pectobacterium actinidiae]|nr:hypothetical protein KKH3_23880 [Pectobacterium actinidiae]